MRQALSRAARDVLQVGVVLHHPGDHLEVGDPAGERVRRGLEHEQRRRLVFVELADGLLAVDGGGDAFPIGGRGQVVRDEVQDLAGSDVVQGGGAHHRVNPHLTDALFNPLDDLLG